MPITALRLRRFRGFADVTLPLKPLTVLLGPNSAGKSCFSHALVGLQQVDRRGGIEPDLTSPPPDERDPEKWPIDFGTFDDLRHSAADPTAEVRIEICWEGLRETADWLLFGFGAYCANGSLTSTTCSQRLPLTFIAPGFMSERFAEGPVKPVQQSVEVVTDASPDPIMAPPAAEPIPANFWRHSGEQWIDAVGRQPTTLMFRGLRLVSALHTDGGTLMIEQGALGEFSNHLRSLRYLAPERAAPSRYYPLPQTTPSSVGSRGQHTAAVLKALARKNVTTGWFPPPPRDSATAQRQREEAAWHNPEERPLADAVDGWMACLGLAQHVFAYEDDHHRALRLDAVLPPDGPGGTGRSLVDVGYGVSQVLPIIVQGLLLGEGDLFVVQAPEAQLHPRAQAALADFFCALVLTGRRALVETHSTAFFTRLRLRAIQDEELRRLIGVHFCDLPAGTCCTAPQEVSLAEEDEVQWPQGFHVEGFEEEMSILVARAAGAPGEEPR